jgi:hypothetical protein
MIAHDQRVRVAQQNPDPMDFPRFERMVREELDHGIERPVCAVASGVFFYAEPVLEDLPLRSERLGGRLAIGLAGGGHRTQEPSRVLDRIWRAGESDLRAPRCDQPGMGRPSGMERRCHRAEISHDTAALRRGQRERVAACSASRWRGDAQAAAAPIGPKMPVGCPPLRWW